MRARITTLVLSLLACFAVSTALGADDAKTVDAINALIDGWHEDAASADESAYFGAMTQDAVFIGTDASERWTRDELRTWAKEHFAKDSAWVFEPIERNITLAESGRTAWFDERLDSPHMGETRGTGVVVQRDGRWKIAHYTLSFAVPNTIADDVISMIEEAPPAPPETIEGLATGRWRAVIEIPGANVPFDLMIEEEEGELAAYYVNADEWIRVPEIRIDEAGLFHFEMDLHDSVVVAMHMSEGTSIRGQYSKVKGNGIWDRLGFYAERTDAPRFPPVEESIEGAPESIDGRWKVTSADDPDDPAIGVFETVEGNTVYGTFLTTVGDYRYLEGTYEGGRLRLSVFDGAHCFRFDATVNDKGVMEGTFNSGQTYETTFTAKRNEDFELSDPFALTKWTGGDDLGEFTFPDPYGRQWSLDDEKFQGEARIIQVMGTWCPNCRDETRYLIDLHNRYADEGLSIVSVCYEVTGDAERNARVVRTYIDRMGIPYPVLIAGGDDGGDKRSATREIGFLDRVTAYPTTVFIDGDGQVEAVHTGFMGPATGEKHLELRAEFERIIEGMLED